MLVVDALQEVGWIVVDAVAEKLSSAWQRSDIAGATILGGGMGAPQALDS